jgi:ornithine decarboxylase
MRITNDYLTDTTLKTPFFVFSRQGLIDRYREFERCFPGASIHYAMKANSEPLVLKTLNEAGSGFEAASKYELDLLKKAGVSPKKIIYGTSVKPLDHIKYFRNYGVDVFACDSFTELEKIAAAAPGSKVYVRAVVNDSGSVFKFSEKFGTEIRNIVPLLMRAKDLGLKPYGVSFHVGSQATNPMAWASALKDLKRPLKDLKKAKIDIEYLNMGGGFPCNYASTEDDDLNLQDIASKTLKAYRKLPYQPKIMLEPGRGMVATSGILVASVIGRVERPTHTWLFLDAGVYNALFEAMAYQGSTRYQVSSIWRSFNSGETMFALAGPTGDSPDIITREALLPKDIDIGHRLLFHNVGAYSLVVTSPFNGFPKPKVYFH